MYRNTLLVDLLELGRDIACTNRTWHTLSGSDRVPTNVEGTSIAGGDGVSLSAFDSGNDISISGDAAYSEDMGGEYGVPEGPRQARQGVLVLLPVRGLDGQQL